MDGNYEPYDYELSSIRIQQILAQPAGQFEEKDSLPDRESLTFTNGFYANCSAVFVDIRDSSKLPAKYQRPQLAKLYRAFISEMVAVLNGMTKVREVNIVGDCVWAVYNTPFKHDIDAVFNTVAMANTLKALLNKHLTDRGYEPIAMGIGADWGRALMIKAGYSGSGINDVVYMGDIVNRAAHLAHLAGRPLTSPVWVGSAFAGNLNEHNASLLRANWSELGTVYCGSVVWTPMSDWVDSL